MTLRFHDLSPDVREALEFACARHGFVPEDFEIVVADPRDQGQGAVSTVTVERVVGGQVQRYKDKASNGASWLAAFEADLAADWFGTPLAD